ncbi:MAG: hypothetical protein ACOYXC_16730 [Candidatus Rifleibacteriota bacterium]
MKNDWNVSGLLLEGISGSGKTAVLEAILSSEKFLRRPFLSSLVLTEHQTQRVLERKEREEGLGIEDNLNLLNQHLTYIEQVNERLERMKWCNPSSKAMRMPFILERFHLTHAYHYQHLKWEDVEDCDRRLARLNCRLCLLTIDESAIESRIYKGRDSSWLNYISRFGSTRKEVIDHFMQQQNQLLNLADKSCLEKLVINTSNSMTGEIAEKALEFWQVW